MKEIREHIFSNDLTAPRMKMGKFITQVVTRDLFNRFKEDFPEYESMKWETFIGVWDRIAERVRIDGICNPLGVKLGSYLGEIKLQILPQKRRSSNEQASQEYGVDIQNLRINTKGKQPMIKWERRWAVKFNKILQFYAFQHTREMSHICRDYLSENSDKLREARYTICQHSIWRQLKINHDK